MVALEDLWSLSAARYSVGVKGTEHVTPKWVSPTVWKVTTDVECRVKSSFAIEFWPSLANSYFDMAQFLSIDGKNCRLSSSFHLHPTWTAFRDFIRINNIKMNNLSSVAYIIFNYKLNVISKRRAFSQVLEDVCWFLLDDSLEDVYARVASFVAGLLKNYIYDVEQVSF